MDNNYIAKQLSKYFENQGVSQVDIANKLGVSKAYVNSLFTGRRPFGKKQAEIWETNFGISKSWLLTGEGEMIANKPSKENAPKLQPYITDNLRRVRFLDVNATASFLELNCYPSPDLSEFTHVLPLPGEEISDDDVVYPVHGESMAPQIPDNSHVLAKLIRPSQWHWAKGVVIIAYDNTFVIKRILENRLDTDNYLILGSDNPDFPETVRVPLADIRLMYHASRIVSSPIF